MAAIRWTRCFADVQIYNHARTIRSYFDDVIVPALETLERRIAELDASHEAADDFAAEDTRDVLQATTQAFALSIHSIWERQLRGYLVGCLRGLPTEALSRSNIERDDWPTLCRYFFTLRGLELTAFPSFASLDMLQLLANACRHGGGASAAKLAARHPQLWPRAILVAPPGYEEDWPPAPSIDGLDVSRSMLSDFASAIASFWDDLTHIYNESLEDKSPSLERQLVKERAGREWIVEALGK